MKTISLVALVLLASPTASLYSATAEENWTKDCMQCHGKTGAADTKMGKLLNAKDLSSPAAQASFTDAEAAEAIKNGVKKDEK